MYLRREYICGRHAVLLVTKAVPFTSGRVAAMIPCLRNVLVSYKASKTQKNSIFGNSANFLASAWYMSLFWHIFDFWPVSACFIQFVLCKWWYWDLCERKHGTAPRNHALGIATGRSRTQDPLVTMTNREHLALSVEIGLPSGGSLCVM